MTGATPHDPELLRQLAASSGLSVEELTRRLAAPAGPTVAAHIADYLTKLGENTRRTYATALIERVPERKSVQTPIDRLTRVDPSVGRTYDLLCNTVHPSVGGTFSYLAAMGQIGPGEVQVEFRQRKVDGQRVETDDVLTAAIKAGIVGGLHWTTESLDDALRLCDDIALTTRVCHIARTPYWRSIVASDRNSPVGFHRRMPF